MEGFSIVKRGYNPQEVDEYIATLEQVIKSYKEKDNSIKNAIVSAQLAADNIIKNAHFEVADRKSRTNALMKQIYDSVESQRARVRRFQDDYTALVRKYLNEFNEADAADIYGKIDALEKFLREASGEMDETSGENIAASN